MTAAPLTYAFQRDETIRAGFVRMVGELSARGQGLARPEQGATEEAVHAARLVIKRLRALLWFVRPALSGAVYARMKTRLRQAAGLLSAQRDLTVALETMKKLGEKISKAHDRKAVEESSRKLVERAKDDAMSEEKLRRLLQRAMKMVNDLAKELTRSGARSKSWPSREERLTKAMRTQKKAGKHARRTKDDADFHEWRKKAKRLFYELELTQPEPDKKKEQAIRKAEELQDNLGEYHDAVVVVERLRENHKPSSSTRRILELLVTRKRQLRKRARKIAQELTALL